VPGGGQGGGAAARGLDTARARRLVASGQGLVDRGCSSDIGLINRSSGQICKYFCNRYVITGNHGMVQLWPQTFREIPVRSAFIFSEKYISV
jgi:hypothetical protein